MASYLLRRLLATVPVALLASAVLFALVALTPGDPVLVQLGEQATPENAAALRRELGLDQPYPLQYLRWLGRVARGDLGASLQTRAPVRDEIAARAPATLRLGLAALALSVAVGLPLGVVAAVRRGSRLGAAATAVAQLGLALPTFVVGLALVYLVAVRLGWLPPGGAPPPGAGAAEGLRRLVLPAATLGLHPAAAQARFVRAELLDALAQDYVRTARAKGLPEWLVVARHALRNALLPGVTLLGVQAGLLLEGAVVVETVFAWPGIGRLALQGLGARDYPVVQAVALLGLGAVLAANLLADLAYGYLDPRIRHARAG